MEIKAKSGQTLLDVAVEQFGSWEALMDIAHDNDISMTDDIQAGSSLLLPEKIYDRRMQLWCKNNNVSPATMQVASKKAGIFTEQFTIQFQ